MPSFQKNYYCKNCKSNVAVDKNGKCKKCGSSRLNVSQSVRFRYITKEGREIQKRLGGFSTKKEANDAYIKFMSEAKIYSKLEKNAKDLTFLELYEEYKSFIQVRIKKSSYQTLIQRAEKHILNYFNKQKVADITPKMILNWQSTIENFSYSYKSHIRTILGNILKYADKYYEIANQMTRVDNFKNLTPKKEMQIWTPHQFELVMDHVKNFEYKVFYSALFYTGARRGEIMATSWDDWDLDKNILNINKTATKKIKGYKYWVDTTKTSSSTRKIKIPSNLASLIAELKKSQKSLGKFVFGGDEPLPETSIMRQLNNAANEANVPIIRVHDLRHSHVSFLISKGVSIVAIAKRLGHSDIEQTLNTYAHMMPNEEDNLIEILEDQTIV